MIRKILNERDCDCRTNTFWSEDGKPVAYSSDVHWTDSDESIKQKSLYRICLPDSTLHWIKENL